ncbi:MAG: family 16 glycoside hydrolase [Planctomycetota bacterium]|jgi:hypothetical protein
MQISRRPVFGSRKRVNMPAAVRGLRYMVVLGAGLVVVGAARAEITLEESVAEFEGDLATWQLPQIQGGTDQTYVLAIATESHDVVTDVSDTLAELTWTERKEQCGVGEETGIRLWTAQGSPSGPFQVQITHAVAGMDQTAVLARYSGVATLEDATGENTNEENDTTCSGTAKTNTAQLTLTSSQDLSVHVVAVCPVQSFINSFSAGYSLINKGQQGRAYTFLYEGPFATATTDQFQATINGGGVKWSTAGIVLSPGAATATTNYRSIGTDTGTLAQTGTATITTGTSVVTFSDTLPTDIGAGDKLTVGGGGPSTLFSDDFEDGVITGWTDIGADSMNETGGTLQSDSATHDNHYTVDAGSGWTDYTVTCDFIANDNDETGISFRVQDANNYYVLYQRFGQGGPMRKYVAGTPTDLDTPIDQTGLAEEVWYTLKVEVSGTSIKCYFNDVEKFNITDSTYSDGTVGVWNFSHDGWFDNMLVTAGAASGDFHILSRDSDTQATVQETAASTLTDETYTIERAYNTMQAWEDDRLPDDTGGRGGDLVGENRCEVGVCYNDGAFSDRLVISGSTTDADHYMMLTVAEGQRHNGIADSGARIDAGGGWTAQNAIDVEDEYTRIEWLEITDVYDAGDAIYFANTPSAANSLAYGIYVHGFWQNNNAAVRVDTTGVTVRNCFMTGGTTYAVRVEASASATIENCTFWGFSGGGYGLHTAAGDVAVKNTISVDHGTLDFYIETSGSATISYFGNNMYSSYGGGFVPGSYQGGNQIPPANLEYLFMSIGSPEDLHLETSGHRAGNTGLDLSGSFSDDVDGATRSGVWDIGADEGVSGTATLTPKILVWQEIEP